MLRTDPFSAFRIAVLAAAGIGVLSGCSPRSDGEAPDEFDFGAIDQYDISSIAAAAFDGAPCWSDRVAECLNPNPELETLYADPALCESREPRVCLVPVGNVRRDVVEAIVDFHRETAGIDVVVLPSIPLEPSRVSADTFQVTEWDLYREMQVAHGVGDETVSTFIAITPFDVKPESGEFEWIFGTRFGTGMFGHNHGVFSYFRMANVPPYDGTGLSDELLRLRVSKYSARYVALLYLDHSAGDDPRFVNYRDMYGFSDLDSMGTSWPEGPAPCKGPGLVICIVPDGDYLGVGLEDDLSVVASRISAELNVRVEVRQHAGMFYPTTPSWSEEFGADLVEMFGGGPVRANLTIIGVTDDAFAQDASVSPHVDRVWPGDQLGVVSAFEAGVPGTEQHRERLYRLLLRAIAQTNYGMATTADGSILGAGVVTPRDLDRATIPDFPALPGAPSGSVPATP